MLAARLLRSDSAAVAANLARRGFKLDVERFQALEDRRKAAQVADCGVGVNSGRLNGYACYFAANGSYTSPTIS